jgi:hypothetical protein
MITGISAVTLATHDMRSAVGFYRLLEMRLLYGGEEAAFTSFAAGDNFLKRIAIFLHHAIIVTLALKHLIVAIQYSGAYRVRPSSPELVERRQRRDFVQPLLNS